MLLFGLNELRMFDLGDKVEEAKGEVAIRSEVDKLENILRASGKFGGVAGVFAGVINCQKHHFISKNLKKSQGFLTENPVFFEGMDASWK